MRKLLLTSQGIPQQLAKTFRKLLQKSPKEIHVSFITTAAYGEENNPTWLEYYRKELRAFGIVHIEDLDLKGKTRGELHILLANKDVIYVNGGNTYYLLHWIRKSRFDKVLPELLDRGVLYVGLSAGSLVTGPSIAVSKWKPNADPDVVGLSDLTGMNLVSFSISPHYKPEYYSTLKKEAKSVSYPVIALSDTQAVQVVDDKWEIMGEGEKIIFNKQFNS